jgi:DNA-binding transcriptional ArsR family regulator
MTAAIGATDIPVGQTKDPGEPLTAAATLFRSLGDSNRLAILQRLVLGEHRVRDLTEHLGLAQSTVSAHCRCLADCGLISATPRGRATVYSLARPELLTLFQVAEQVLLATGGAVELCPTYGKSDRRAS